MRPGAEAGIASWEDVIATCTREADDAHQHSFTAVLSTAANTHQATAGKTKGNAGVRDCSLGRYPAACSEKR